MLIFLCLLASSSVAQVPEGRAATAPDSSGAAALLLKISQAAQSVSYSGVQEKITPHAGRQMRFVWRVYRWAPQRLFVQFLEPDTMQETIFYKDATILKTRGDRHIMKSLRRGGLSRLLQDGQALQEIELLQKNYHIRLQRGDSYLGRPIIELAIEPKYDGRPRFYARVDAETGILLETRRVPGHGADSLTSVIRFLEIRYSTPDFSPADQIFTTIDSLRESGYAQRFTDLGTLLGMYPETLLIPGHVPAGYGLRKIRAFKEGRRAFVHLLYGDGLSVISLFQRKNGHHSHRRQTERRRFVSDLSLVRGEMAGVHYDIVGEIPTAELEEMAKNLVPISRQSSRMPGIIYFFAGLAVATGGILILRKYREKADA